MFWNFISIIKNFVLNVICFWVFWLFVFVDRGEVEGRCLFFFFFVGIEV